MSLDRKFLEAQMLYEKIISDLEAKLAEKEKEIEELKQRLKDTIKIYSDDFVEKDKELKELRFQARNIFPFVENLEEKINQDKISFAVEQLEKVKELLLIESKEHPIVYDITNDIVGGAIDRDKGFSTIDNQIKAIKGE